MESAKRQSVLFTCARQHEVSQALIADQNDFPREIALEAILRYIEEDLDTAETP
jgi:hypothetical protein